MGGIITLSARRAIDSPLQTYAYAWMLGADARPAAVQRRCARHDDTRPGRWLVLRWRRRRRMVDGAGAHSSACSGAPVSVPLMHGIWAVAQMSPCIHMGNCPSSWATAQEPKFKPCAYITSKYLGNSPSQTQLEPPACLGTVFSMASRLDCNRHARHVLLFINMT